MTIGVGVTMASNILIVTHSIPSFFDITAIGAGLSLFLYNIAIISNHRSRFARYTQRQVIHYLDEYIFVLDERQKIVDSNQPAIQFFASQGIPLANAGLQHITDALRKKGKQVDDDFHIEDGPFPITLNLRIHDLPDESGSIIGHIAVFTDVTQNRMLIERLEATAKIDSLTGLPNRGAFEGAIKRLDSPEYFPLAVILGDVNQLKDVNDNLGHQYGDMMLQKVAEVLKETCPKNCFLGRIGGDEFIFLYPLSSQEKAADLMAEIKTNLALRKNLPFALSIALGCGVKSESGEDLNDIMMLADSRMYEDKKAFKKSSRKEQALEVSMQNAE